MSQTAAATTTTDTLAAGLPAPGIWDVDPTHSNVEFVVRHVRRMRAAGTASASVGRAGCDGLAARQPLSSDRSRTER